MEVEKTKKRGFISFSGGETSGYMLYWLLHNKSDEYDFKILFSNTGCENEETLDFVEKCAREFGIEIIWVERDFSKGRNGGHTVVSYETATRLKDWRNGKNPFEIMVKKFGLPNNKNKFSTRELKLIPMLSYLRSIGWEDDSYDTFIGLRNDEIDRISKDRIKQRIVYPLIQYIQWTKKHVNFWWANFKFRLHLKGYEGNCIFCYKKADFKIAEIFKSSPELLLFADYLEFRYAYYIPESRYRDTIVKKLKPLPKFPLTLYRENKSLWDCISKARDNVVDDSEDKNYQTYLLQDESCELFTECGTDN